MKKTIYILFKFGSCNMENDDASYDWEVVKCAFRKKEQAVEYVHKEINSNKLTNMFDIPFSVAELPTEDQLFRPYGWSVGPDYDCAGYRIEEIEVR